MVHFSNKLYRLKVPLPSKSEPSAAVTYFESLYYASNHDSTIHKCDKTTCADDTLLRNNTGIIDYRFSLFRTCFTSHFIFQKTYFRSKSTIPICKSAIIRAPKATVDVTNSVYRRDRTLVRALVRPVITPTSVNRTAALVSASTNC